MTWTDSNGNPLKFQEGDPVRIDTSSNPAHGLPFTSGYVRGYNLQVQEGSGTSVAYELYRMGHHPLRWVKEEFLSLAPDPHKHAHPSGRKCQICGKPASETNT